MGTIRPMEGPAIPDGRTTVLLVDDDERFRALARGLLADDGYRIVGEAGTAVDAVRLARQLRPDAIVLDLVMPEVDEALGDDGHEPDDVVLDLVSAEESGLRAAAELLVDGSGSCVVIVSSLFDPTVERRARRIGATYVEKVAGIDALERAIDAGVARRRAALG